MRRLGLAVLALVFLLSAAAPVGAFEGTLKWRMLQVGKEPLGKVAGDASNPDKVFAVPLETLMSMHGEAKVTEATIYVKGSLVRADTTARDGQGYFVMNLDTGVTKVVMPSQKSVMTVDRDDVAAMQQRMQSMRSMLGRKIEKGATHEQIMDSVKGVEEKEPDIEVISLDKKQTINGLETNAYEVRGAKQSIVGWLTDQRPEVLELFRKLEKSRAQISPKGNVNTPKAALARKGLPVRVQTLDEKQYTLEDLIEVDTKPIDDAMFVIPADYVQSSARSVMQNAGQLKKPGAPANPAAQPKAKAKP